MARTAVDTSVLVAAFLGWHQHHRPALAALESLLENEGEIGLPAHVLFETYSVLTRLPGAQRLAPAVALEMLQKSLKGVSRLLPLAPETQWDALASVAGRLVAGGAVYDALILECVRQAGITRVVTLNGKHFERVKPPGVTIIDPLAESASR